MSENIKKMWLDLFSQVPSVLEKVKEVETVVTAFNTNVDAVLKIDGKRLGALIAESNLSLDELQNIEQAKLLSSVDVIKGIFKCFSSGIAEEWLSEEKDVYDWMIKNLLHSYLKNHSFNK